MIILVLLLSLSSFEADYLMAAVEAEAGICSPHEKMLVASAIMNRVESEEFPDTVAKVIEQPGQFQVYSNGRVHDVEVTQETKRAVMKVLIGRFRSDILYFCNYEISDPGNQAWFDTLDLVIEAEYMNYYR